MINILTKNFDITDFFINDKLDKISEISENLSEHSKITDIPLLEDYKNKKDNDFALVLISPKGEIFQKYAMYNAGLTELNMAFLASAVTELPEEIVKTAGANLTASAHYFNLDIPKQLQKYASSSFISRYIDTLQIDEAEYIKKLSKIKSPAEDKVYALKNSYPITTVEDMNKSASWFNKNYTKLDLDEQQDFVENILRRSDELKEPIKYANIIDEFKSLNKNIFNGDLKSHLNIRKSYIEDDESAVVLDDLWKQREDIGPYKTAYVLEVLDKELNLDSLYGHKILDPLRSVLGTTKTASVVFNGVSVTNENLNNLKSTDLGCIVGEGLISDIKSDKGLTVFKTLPDPIKKEITEIL